MSPAVGPVQKPAFAWPSGIRGALSLTFDDGRASQVEQGVPLFDRYGVRATFYVMPAAVALRQEAWRKAVATGHEAAGHTLTHPCTCNFGFVNPARNLESMTLDMVEEELIGAKLQIEELVGVKPVSFAYPCGQKFVGRGEQLKSYVPLVAKHYLTGRGWRDEFFNAPDRCDLAQLAGIEFDGSSFEQVLPQIVQAASTGNWLVLAGHDIGPGPRNQMTNLATLEAICAYCTDPANGIWIDTVGTIGAYINKTRGV
jgi:peptidoglycan/xylan/chitin deacetylase (PgdA/CDA1 family)